MDPDKLGRLLFGIDMNVTEAGIGTVQVLVGTPSSVKLEISDWNLIYQSLGDAIHKLNSNSSDKKKTQYTQLNF
jgi:hypothetical protein